MIKCFRRSGQVATELRECLNLKAQVSACRFVPYPELFGDVWERPGLSKRDRSLITVTALVSLYRTDQLGFHLRTALETGLTQDELVDFYLRCAPWASSPSMHPTASARSAWPADG